VRAWVRATLSEYQGILSQSATMRKSSEKSEEGGGGGEERGNPNEAQGPALVRHHPYHSTPFSTCWHQHRNSSFLL
jgi:hypothetical protein